MKFVVNKYDGKKSKVIRFPCELFKGIEVILTCIYALDNMEE